MSNQSEETMVGGWLMRKPPPDIRVLVKYNTGSVGVAQWHNHSMMGWMWANGSPEGCWSDYCTYTSPEMISGWRPLPA